MNNNRRAAAYALATYLATHDFPSRLLPEGKDRAFVQDLVYTAIRRMRPIRKILGELVKTWPKGELEALLYVGAAQIMYMDDVPDFAAVNETVEAAKECPNPNVARVVNGVLRNLIRRKDELMALLAKEPLDVRESFPRAIARRWIARFGETEAEKLCRWHNEPAETFVARPDGSFTVLARGERVESVKGFAEGEFIVQDPATALAVKLMDAKPGERILDACAAPGGKTVQLAWRGAAVTACEVNPRRRRRLEENIARTGVKVGVVAELPAAGDFDKVLVDAPCSNSGVFRRRPDARWNWSEAKLAELNRLQAEILGHCAKLVKAGGRLVYSTCSIEPEENLGMVKAFLGAHPEFTLVASEEAVPLVTGFDGAFAAAMEKK